MKTNGWERNDVHFPGMGRRESGYLSYRFRALAVQIPGRTVQIPSC
jgi:hypothetical protein